MIDSAIFKRRETWQSRARECRTAARHFRNAEAQRRMLMAAEDFDRMALEVKFIQPAEAEHSAAKTL